MLKACNAAGWIGEHIRVDYGEDLAFQTNFKGDVDPFRIYAQCKSTMRSPKRISVSRRHLLRWSMMGELVVIFLYKKASDEIVFYEVNERFSFLQAWQLDSSSMSIPLSEFSPLDAKGLRQLEWLSRIRGMSFLASQLSNRHMTAQTLDILADTKKILADQDEAEAGVFYLFLSYLDFMKPEVDTYALHSSGPLGETLEAIEGRLSGKRKKGEHELSIHEFLTLAILIEWEKTSGGLGLSTLVMAGASFWLKVFVFSYFNERGYSFSRLERVKL